VRYETSLEEVACEGGSGRRFSIPANKVPFAGDTGCATISHTSHKAAVYGAPLRAPVPGIYGTRDDKSIQMGWGRLLPAYFLLAAQVINKMQTFVHKVHLAHKIGSEYFRVKLLFGKCV
jgi:hypothetical protein